MNAIQKLKHLILILHSEMCEDFVLPEVTAENIDALYDAANGEGWGLQEARMELRHGDGRRPLSELKAASEAGGSRMEGEGGWPFGKAGPLPKPLLKKPAQRSGKGAPHCPGRPADQPLHLRAITTPPPPTWEDPRSERRGQC